MSREMSESQLRRRFETPLPRERGRGEGPERRRHPSSRTHTSLNPSDEADARTGDASELPSPPAPLPRERGDRALTPLERALTDGEDFELVFCVSEADAKRLLASKPPSEALHAIGRIVEGDGVTVIDANGAPMKFESAGWVHRW